VFWVALSTHSEKFPGISDLYSASAATARAPNLFRQNTARTSPSGRRYLETCRRVRCFCRAYISNTSNVADLALFFWAGRAWLIPAG
jgi:hypothetical protein